MYDDIELYEHETVTKLMFDYIFLENFSFYYLEL